MKPIECLERRLLLDGDVTASFSDGDLSIRGDDGDNYVRILQPQAGTIRVVGLDETTVNGEEAVEFAGSLGDLRILMRQGGEDTIEVRGPIQIGGDVNARLGEGELAIEGTLGPVEIAGNVFARGGSQGDVRFRNEVIVHGRTVGIGAAVTAAATPGILPDFSAATFSNPLVIDNPYFPLVPGTTYVYEERSVDEETGEEEVETVTMEVTNDTRTILGVQIRVVRAKEVIEGLLVEDTFDFYAQDDNGNVWYFGEDTTEFEYDDEGNLIGQSTAGSFQAGVDGARAGIIMPANPQVGDAYFQEILAGEAIDQGTVLARGETVMTDLGTFNDVLRIGEANALEPDGVEHNLYAPGFGQIGETKFDIVTGEEDGEVRLLSATQNGQPVTQVVSPDNMQGANATGTATSPVQFLGDVSFTSEDDAIARNVNFENNAYITSQGDVIVQDSVLNDEPAFVSPDGSIALRDLMVTSETFVRAGEDVVIEDATFEDALLVRFFNGGDNNLVVGDSTFATLNADGGRGENTFEDLGENEFDERVLKRFDVVVELEETKLNIEHNATDLDTGFQGFIDGEGWQRLDVTGPDGNVVLTFRARGSLAALGLTELFFETVEPENADVPTAEILAKLAAGEYSVQGPAIEDGKVVGQTTGTASLTHAIPQGPELLTPADDSDLNENETQVFDWEPVTQTIDGQPVNVIAYQVIIEKVAAPHPNMIGKIGVSAYLPSNVTSFTLPVGFLEPDTAYEWEVLAIEESGNQTISSSAFTTGAVTGSEPPEPDDPPNLKEAKLIIEHNATDLDTGFQGFIDSEGWQRLDVIGPDGETVLTFEGSNELGELGLTELFFETVEPENADVPIEEILAALPAGNYTISGPSMQNGESGGTTSGTAVLSHLIPAGPQLLAPSEGATVPDDGLVVSWNPVTQSIKGEPVNIIAYQLIIEEEDREHPDMIGTIGLSMYLPATTTSVTVPNEILKPGTSYEWEVLAIEESGNQTISESEFQTAEN